MVGRVMNRNRIMTRRGVVSRRLIVVVGHCVVDERLGNRVGVGSEQRYIARFDVAGWPRNHVYVVECATPPCQRSLSSSVGSVGSDDEHRLAQRFTHRLCAMTLPIQRRISLLVPIARGF